ncbi:hypothetical protein [Aestuariivivens insulae]|uniref:hypothetical protein n=1 Tax=Aestuariivivens insulae TaxID=1621988 RepID=UPI001F5AE310|nr:hypothetical protein [Aestuariivivens insulae]
MAKQKGVIKLKGTTQGVCYYKLNGKYIARKASGPSKERINTDPAFANVKANNQEFAAAVLLSKAIRTGLGEITKQFKDTYMASRLTGVCRLIIQQGRGEQGKREANLLNQPNKLIGFELNKSNPFKQIYTAPIKIEHNTGSRAITITVPKSSEANLKRKPKKATHFKLTGAVSCVSVYQWQNNSAAYKPLEPHWDTLGELCHTKPLQTNKQHQHIQIKLQMPMAKAMPSLAAITVWTGITFGTVIEDKFEAIETSKAMQCLTIL